MHVNVYAEMPKKRMTCSSSGIVKDIFTPPKGIAHWRRRTAGQIVEREGISLTLTAKALLAARSISQQAFRGSGKIGRSDAAMFYEVAV